MRVFFSAGEASGDVYAAEIAKLIRAQANGQEPTIEGVGGLRFQQTADRMVADSSLWGAIGLVQVLRIYRFAVGGFYAAKRALSEGTPGLFLPIDYGYMNVRLSKHAKNHGWKVLYFSPPGAWRRDRQGSDLAALTDVIVTPFSWSADLLNKMGARAYWFGHPIKQMIAERSDPSHRERTTIAVLPGSRRSELELLLPVIAEATQDLPDTLEFAVAHNFDPERLRTQWQALCPARKNDQFTHGDTLGVLQRARAGIICSGTATLEAALCHCPHVVVYKVDRWTELQARLIRLRVDHISQPNLLLQRSAVPELVQQAATPTALESTLRSVLEDGSVRSAQLQAFQELEEMLGPSDALTRTAELALSLLSETRS